MSTSALAGEQRRTTWIERTSDYVELTKPKIALLVLATVAVAYYAASWGQPDPLVLLHTLLGVALVAASASALNQWLEVDRDAAMDRTATRPLPAGRLTGRQVVVFAAACIVAGLAYLTFTVGWQSAVWGLATWAMYVWIYTPLKSRTALNTAVGAIAGALPTLIGWSAAGGELDLRAAALFLIVFLWQFPHFMAIAWIYRRQYGHAGLKMLTVVDPSGRRAGSQAVWAALALAPVSITPAVFTPTAGAIAYMAAALLLAVLQLACAAMFLRERTDESARLLLRASLIYLPLLLVCFMFIPLA